MRPFVHQPLSGRVIFGEGTLAQLPDELDRLGLKRALVLATPQQRASAEQTAAKLEGRSAGVFSEAAMHTPVAVTERAMIVVRDLAADGFVAIGGGSTTGLAKALALRTGLPQVVAPTTYAGSEMTPILGETRDGVKTTIRDLKVLPQTVIYDVDLTLSLPSALSATSGLNAIAHAVEALYAPDGNPVISLMAEEGVRAFAAALPRIAADPANREARSDALYGAWLCGSCLGAVAMALHHKLCHVLGGSFDLPHAETHAIVLPHAAAYNAPAAPEAMARLAHALQVENAPRGLWDLAGRIGAPRALRDLGMKREGIGRAVDLALANPYANPRPLEREALTRLIEAAFEGSPP